MAIIQDQIPSVLLLSKLQADQLDQSALDVEVYIHEGVEMTAEDMKGQLALIPEVNTTPSVPVNMEEANIGEVENTIEEIQQMRDILEEKKHCFIRSGKHFFDTLHDTTLEH
jgi:hypothetical protein